MERSDVRNADALYRVVSNYTDGFQSRIIVAKTPDNTFTPLSDNMYVMNERQRDRIIQIAHLLPLMSGEVVLSKLEERVENGWNRSDWKR